MKKWIVQQFLPMWAKETVLADNRTLTLENRALKQRLREREAYILGLEQGLRTVRAGNRSRFGKEEKT